MSTTGNRGKILSKHRPGYSLAELAVVLVLIGIILSVVLPRFSFVGDQEKLKNACRSLAFLAREGQVQAATHSRAYYLCLDLDGARVWLSATPPDRDHDGDRVSREVFLPSGLRFKDVEHPGRGMVREGRVAFAYWPRGGSEPGTVHLISEDGSQMTLFLMPYLGRVEIGDGYLRQETS